MKYLALKNGVKSFQTEEQNEEEPQVIVTADVPPMHMICPLTHKVMEDPGMTREGQTFERKVILSKLDICTGTKKPLRPSGIVANGKLHWEIRKWQLNFGDAAEEMTRLELESELSNAEMISRAFRQLRVSDTFGALAVKTGKEDCAAPEKVVTN